MNRRRNRFPDTESFHSTLGFESEAGEILWAEYDRRKVSKFVVYCKNLVRDSNSIEVLEVVRQHLFRVVEENHPEKHQSFMKNVATAVTRNKKNKLK